jgi:hypothetical protein
MLKPLNEQRISCEAPPPPRDDAPAPPPPEAYHARRGTRWLASCIRSYGAGTCLNEAAGEQSHCPPAFFNPER